MMYISVEKFDLLVDKIPTGIIKPKNQTYNLEYGGYLQCYEKL